MLHSTECEKLRRSPGHRGVPECTYTPEDVSVDCNASIAKVTEAIAGTPWGARPVCCSAAGGGAFRRRLCGSWRSTKAAGHTACAVEGAICPPCVHTLELAVLPFLRSLATLLVYREQPKGTVRGKTPRRCRVSVKAFICRLMPFSTRNRLKRLLRQTRQIEIN